MQLNPTLRHVNSWLASHHCVIGRKEALRCGLTDAHVRYLLDTGEWHRIYRGVYGPAASPPTGHGLLRAAVVAGGRDAAVSHLSSAWLWSIHDRWPAVPTITVPHQRTPQVTGIQVVRTRHLVHPVNRHGIPATSVIRTLIDCAGDLPPDELDALVDTAIARKAITVASLTRSTYQPDLRWYPGRLLLAKRLEERGITGAPNPTVLESRMARLLRRHHLPVPKAEVDWGPDRQYRLDFAYPAIHLAIEVDGWVAHLTPEKQRADHRRQRRLNLASWTVLHFDWWEVTFEPERVAGEIAAAYRSLAA